MRRLLTDPLQAVARLANAVRDGWNRFVFTPADPTSLGVVRVATGILAFWSLFVYGLDLQGFFGSTGWSTPEGVTAFLKEVDPTAWSFWLAIPDGLLRPVWIVCLVILALFTCGAFSRVTSVLAWAIIASTVRRSPVTVYGFDQILSTLCLYLAVTGASGKAVSLDRYYARWRRNRAEVARRSKTGTWTAPSGRPEPSIAANIALRLIQCHLVLIYGMAGLAKLQGPAWWNGSAFWGTVAAGEFRLFDLTWLASYPQLINAFTHAGLAVELLYPIVIWNRAGRPIVLAIVTLMHIGIGITLGLVEFSLVMVAANLAFVSGPWLRSLVAGAVPGQVAGRVLYDGACPRCRASMAIVSAGDPDRLIEPVDLTAVDVTKVHPSLSREACMRSMHLVTSKRKVKEGYDAVMAILGWTPLFWPISLVRFIPGVSVVGRKVYNRIAASRPRDVVCNDEVCGIHPPSSAQVPASTGRSAR